MQSPLLKKLLIPRFSFSILCLTSMVTGESVLGNLVFYGGSFNPPHEGHVRFVEDVLNTSEDMRVCIVPSASPAATATQVRKINLAPYAHRKKICQLMFARLGARVEVSDLESEAQPKGHRTFDTMERSQWAFQGMMMGQDQLESFSGWYKAKELMDRLKIFVKTRSEHSIKMPVIADMVLVSTERYPASSTEIRKRLQAGEDLPDGWLNTQSLEYIEKNNLYK